MPIVCRWFASCVLFFTQIYPCGAQLSCQRQGATCHLQVCDEVETLSGWTSLHNLHRPQASHQPQDAAFPLQSSSPLDGTSRGVGSLHCIFGRAAEHRGGCLVTTPSCRVGLAPGTCCRGYRQNCCIFEEDLSSIYSSSGCRRAYQQSQSWPPACLAALPEMQRCPPG